MMAKPNSNNLEEQLKSLQTHFGSIVVTVKDLKSSVNRLERKVDEREDEELRDKVITANEEAIKKLDEQLMRKSVEIDLNKDHKETNDETVKKIRKQKCADTSTEASANTRINVDLFTRKKSVNNI